MEEGKQDHIIKWGCVSIENLKERWNGGGESGKKKKQGITWVVFVEISGGKMILLGMLSFEVNKGWVLKKK